MLINMRTKLMWSRPMLAAYMGISKDVVKRADHLVRIPMAGNFDSLNVSVAAGMMLYEAMRQRMTAGGRN